MNLPVGETKEAFIHGIYVNFLPTIVSIYFYHAQRTCNIRKIFGFLQVRQNDPTLPPTLFPGWETPADHMERGTLFGPSSTPCQTFFGPSSPPPHNSQDRNVRRYNLVIKSCSPEVVGRFPLPDRRYGSGIDLSSKSRFILRRDSFFETK